MSVLGLWREDVNVDDLADEPRWFIEGVARGESEEIAAQRAGVTLEDVRRWTTDGKFRQALKQARRGHTAATLIGGDDDQNATTTVRPDGTVEVHSDVRCFRCLTGCCDIHPLGQSKLVKESV